MPVENTTPNRLYQLPFADNDLVDDVARLIVAMMAVDLDVASLFTAVATKAAAIHGHVIADTTGLSAALESKQDLDEKGQANGFAALDATGKVPTSQLPAAVLGAMSYQTTWNANTNSPTIPAASAANKGHFYKVATPGTTNVSGITDWQIGDLIVSNGSSWDKIDNTDQVVSVAGLAGVITAAALVAALAGQTFTLAQPVLTLKRSSNPTPTSEGATEWDEDDDVLVIGDGTGRKVFVPIPASAVAGDIEVFTGAKVKGRVALGAARTTLRVNAAGNGLEYGGGSGAPDAILEHQLASGSNGGATTAGSWLERALNTEVRDQRNLITLASNRFTPAADGWVDWLFYWYSAGAIRTRLRNVTDSTTVSVGDSGLGASGVNVNSVAGGCGPVVAGKTYVIEYYCSTSSAAGLGAGATVPSTVEVFGRVRYWRD